MHTGCGPCCDTCERDGGFFGTVPPPRDFVSLLRCSGCFVAMYCSRACQAKAWRKHKPVCRESCVALAKARAALLEAAAAEEVAATSAPA